LPLSLIFANVPKCTGKAITEATAHAIQSPRDDTPPGPQMYSDGCAFGPTAYEPMYNYTDLGAELEHVLDGLPLLEREAVRARNGLDANGPWHDLWVVSSDDIEADIADFDEILQALVEFEDPSSKGGAPAPRMHYIRELIHEALWPLCMEPPEVFDVGKNVFYDAPQRAHLMRRISLLLGALTACQTLDMNARELCSYCTQTHETPEQVDRTRSFIQLAQRYSAEFGSA
jgi:hypothetical protein